MIIFDKWNNLKMEERSTITIYLQQINFILNQLKKIDKYPRDLTIAYKILKSLPKKVNIFKTIIRSKEIILNINIFTILFLIKEIILKNINFSQKSQILEIILSYIII